MKWWKLILSAAGIIIAGIAFLVTRRKYSYQAALARAKKVQKAFLQGKIESEKKRELMAETAAEGNKHARRIEELESKEKDLEKEIYDLINEIRRQAPDDEELESKKKDLEKEIYDLTNEMRRQVPDDERARRFNDLFGPPSRKG